jgi:SAM-dependent methyltransferase
MQDLPSTFQCNVCGAACAERLEVLAREMPSCPDCRSSPRIRSVVDLLARKLFGRSMPLSEFPENKLLRGVGMTDSASYAHQLANKFDYQNTYYDTEPRLDTSGPLEQSLLGVHDFVISSEVFEHVQPPVRRAFENVFNLLKPNGLFVLTVPYGLQDDTIEHFPELHEFKVEKVNGKHILTNLTIDGRIQIFDELVFHGGPGQTLEMRIFSEKALLRHLAAAGFVDVEVHRAPCLEFGISWPQLWSLPITARKPSSRQQ